MIKKMRFSCRIQEKALTLQCKKGKRGFHHCNRGVAQSGSAPGLGPGGRRFESCHPDKKGKQSKDCLPFFYPLTSNSSAAIDNSSNTKP